MRYSRAFARLVGAVSILGVSAAWSAASALPSSVTFTFDAVKNQSGVTVVSGLTSGAGTASIKTYMNNVLSYYGFGSNVADVTNGIADNGYSADRHVTGPAWGTNGCTTGAVGYDNGVCPLALWNTDGAVAPDTDTSKWHLATRDVYLANVGGTTAGNDRISMSLNGLSIDRISFDLQIFPDGACADGGNSTCPNTSDADWPDLNLWVNGTNPANWFGADPAASGYTGFKRSPLLSTETAPQLLTTSGIISFSATSNLSLDFVDWPAKIGIDNLTIYFTPPGGGGQNEVPEPGTLALVGAGLAGLWSMRRKRAA